MNQEIAEEQQRDWLWLALIICAGIALRAVAIVGFKHVPESDELVYMSMALNLISGNRQVVGSNEWATTRCITLVTLCADPIPPYFSSLVKSFL